MIVEDQHMSAYLMSEGIGSSTLKSMLQSPKDFLYTQSQKSKETTATALGTLIHTYLLEPHKFDAEYILQPEDWGSLSKNPGKSKWDALKAQAKEENKKPIKFSEGEYLVRLMKEAKKHTVFQDMIANSKKEVSFYGSVDGVDLKSREDIWMTDKGEVWDIKTFSSDELDEESLARTIFKWGYHFSAAHHIAVMESCGIEVKSWGWAMVSTKTPAPHIILKRASKDFLRAGKQDFNRALSLYKMCKEENRWPGFDDDIQEIDLPRYAQNYYN